MKKALAIFSLAAALFVIKLAPAFAAEIPPEPPVCESQWLLSCKVTISKLCGDEPVEHTGDYVLTENYCNCEVLQRLREDVRIGHTQDGCTVTGCSANFFQGCRVTLADQSMILEGMGQKECDNYCENRLLPWFLGDKKGKNAWQLGIFEEMLKLNAQEKGLIIQDKGKTSKSK